MRILLINYEFPPLGGGGGVITAQIAAQLAWTHEVDVLTSGHLGLLDYEVMDRVGVYRVPVWGRREQSRATLVSLLSFPVSSIPRGIKLCRNRKYDVINTHFALPSGPTGVFLSRLFKIPNVLSMHGGDIYDPTKSFSPHRHWLLRKAVKFVLSHSTHLLAESRDVKARALEYYNVRKEIDIIPWGLKQPSFKKLDRVKLGLSTSDFLLITVGRLVKRKGLDYLLQALAKTQKPDIKLLIVGNGPEKERLESLAATLKITKRVVFIGHVSEDRKFQYLSVSDLFVLPSLHEGFGLVFLEAMYCGLPIVTTNMGGQTDFVRHGRNGVLVPVKDANALARAIAMLTDNCNLRKRMSINNRADVQQFSISSTCERYERLFEDVVRTKEENK